MVYAIWILCAVAALLHVLDVLSTNRALATGDREANPCMALAMRLFGASWWVPKMVLGIGFCGAMAWAGSALEGYQPLVVFVLVGNDLLYAVIVVKNFRNARS